MKVADSIPTEEIHRRWIEDPLAFIESAPSLGVYTIEGKDTASGFAKPKIFCNACGCTIATLPMKWGGKIVVIRPNLFDDGLEMESVRLKEEWFTAHRPSLFSACEGLTQFETTP